MLGKDYGKNLKLKDILDDYINEMSVDTNISGKEIVQPKKTIEARGIGNRVYEQESFNERRTQEQRDIRDNHLNNIKDIYDKEIQAKNDGDVSAEKAAYKERQDYIKNNNVFENEKTGISDVLDMERDGGIFDTMTVRPSMQDEGVVHDLTMLEDKMGAIFAEDIKQGAATAVRAVNRLFIGEKGGEGGLRSYILDKIPSAGKSINLKGLEERAVTTDVNYHVKDQVKKIKAEKAKEKLPKYENLLKNLTESDPLNPDPTYLTPEMKQQNIQDIMDKISKYSKLMEEANDGGGGPGFHDGVGGLGSMFGGLWGTIKGAFAKEKEVNTNPIPSPLQAPAPIPESVTAQMPVQNVDMDIPQNIPKQYISAMQTASKHTSIPLKDLTGHFTSENGNNWDPKLRGKEDPSDFGVTQLNPSSISTITGTVRENARNYFKDNFGHSFNPEDGNDQILAAAVYHNYNKQFALPALGIKNPTKRDILISYNMGATGYVNSLKPNASKELINRRKRYEALLIRNGVNLDD